MKIPIPSDWTEDDDWFCVQIQWPNSPLWIAILTGFLSLPSYGYFWDEKSGNVRSVQAIGRAIFDANFPYVDCSGATIPDTGGDNDTIHAVLSISSEVAMSLCGYNPKAFKIEDGVLYVRDFCGEWVAIGDVTANNDTTYPPPDDWPFIEPPEDGYSPCGKAHNVAVALEALAAYIWDNADNTVPPFFIWGAQDAVGFDLKNTYMYELYALTLGLKGIRTLSEGLIPVTRETVLPEDVIESMQCQLVGQMSSTALESDGEVLDQSLDTMFNNIWSRNSPDGISANSWWRVIKAAIGKAMMINLANAGATDFEQDCTCPQIDLDDGTTDPTTSGWYWGVYRPEQNVPVPYNPAGAFPFDEWGYAYDLYALPHDVYGVEWVVELVNGSVNAYKRSNDNALNFTNDHEFMGSNSDSLTLGVKYVQVTAEQFAELYPTPDANTVRIAPLSGDGTNTVGSPIATKDQIALMMLSCHLGTGTSAAVRLKEVRWLHNSGSPSHS